MPTRAMQLPVQQQQSEHQPAPAASPPATPAPAPEPAPAAVPQQDEPLGDAGLRALHAERDRARDLERQLKELQPLADRARELEESQKTEAQKLAEQVQAATAEASEANLARLRLEAAMDAAPAGMDFATIRAMAARLNGATPEELQRDAAELFQLIPQQSATPAPAASTPQTPVENLRPGALPTQPAPSLADQIAAAERAGDRGEAMRLKSMQLAEVRRQQKP